MDITEGRHGLAPKAVESLTINQAGDVSTLLHPQTGHIYIINGVAKRIIELCDGHKTASQITSIICTEFSAASPERVAEDLDRFVTKAVEKGILTSA